MISPHRSGCSVPFRAVIVVLTLGIVVATAVSVYYSLIVYGYNARVLSTRDNGMLAAVTVQNALGYVTKQLIQILQYHAVGLSMTVSKSPASISSVGDTLTFSILLELHKMRVLISSWASTTIACTLPNRETVCFLDAPTQQFWGIYRNYTLQPSSAGRRVLPLYAEPSAEMVCGPPSTLNGWDPISKLVFASQSTGNVTCTLSTDLPTIIKLLVIQANSLPIPVTIFLVDPASGTMLGSSLNGTSCAAALEKETNLFKDGSDAILGTYGTWAGAQAGGSVATGTWVFATVRVQVATQNWVILVARERPTYVYSFSSELVIPVLAICLPLMMLSALFLLHLRHLRSYTRFMDVLADGSRTELCSLPAVMPFSELVEAHAALMKLVVIVAGPLCRNFADSLAGSTSALCALSPGGSPTKTLPAQEMVTCQSQGWPPASGRPSAARIDGMEMSLRQECDHQLVALSEAVCAWRPSENTILPRLWQDISSVACEASVASTHPELSALQVRVERILAQLRQLTLSDDHTSAERRTEATLTVVKALLERKGSSLAASSSANVPLVSPGSRCSSSMSNVEASTRSLFSRSRPSAFQRVPTDGAHFGIHTADASSPSASDSFSRGRQVSFTLSLPKPLPAENQIRNAPSNEDDGVSSSPVTSAANLTFAPVPSDAENSASGSPDPSHSGVTTDRSFPSSSTLPPAQPASVSDFTILKPLGADAVGKLFLCQRRSSAEVNVLKIISKEVVQAHAERTALEHELAVLKSLSHPCIVGLRASFSSSTHLFIVLEHVEGSDGEHLLTQQGTLSITAVPQIVAQIAIALDYIHRAGYLHRDIKPENLVISADLRRAKVTGFALATPISSESAQTPPVAKTRTSVHRQRVYDSGIAPSVVGTPDYVAPERLSGGPCGPEVDWWSLGIVIYEFLVGAPPFNDDHPHKIFHRIQAEQPHYPETLPTVAVSLMFRLLQKDPGSRLSGLSAVREHPFFAEVTWDAEKTSSSSSSSCASSSLCCTRLASSGPIFGGDRLPPHESLETLVLSEPLASSRGFAHPVRRASTARAWEDLHGLPPKVPKPAPDMYEI
eukprot:RCo023719